MKKALLIFICMITLAASANRAKANYAAGGELIYVHIADSTYQFFFKLYRDCAGNAEPDTIPLCFFNPCTNLSFTVQMPKWVNQPGPPINTGCQVKTTCDSPGALIGGYKEYWYAAVVVMPARCNAWKIFISPGNRNDINNYQNPLSSRMYIETTMNNTLTHSNSSPFYSVKPILYAGRALSMTYNSGAIDADGDSLWTDIIYPRTSVSNCNDTPVNMTFDTASPPYNLNTNPFQTNNTFYCLGATGYIAFESRDTGKANVAVRTREYRNGVLIGSVMREMQVQTLNATIQSYLVTTLDSMFTFQKFYGCPGSNMTFTIYLTATDTSANWHFEDNLSTSIPGATMTYVKINDSLYTATFNWVPTQSLSNHSFVIIGTDSTCRPPGILHQWADAIDITIWDSVKAHKDTTICAGQAAFLSVSGGAQYQWTVISGSQNSLSNPNAANPVATPTTTTTYVVTSTINPYCTGINKDTVTVTVRPSTPGANAIGTSFGCGHNPLVNYINTCPGQNISFCFNTQSTDNDALLYPSDNSATSMPAANISYTGHGSNSINGTFSWTPGPNDIGFHSVALTTYDSACITGNGSPTKQQTVGIIVWGPPKITGDTFICPGESVQLTASGGLGYHWRILSGGSLNSLSDTSIYNPVATPDSTTTYVVTSLANTYCSNNKDSITVQVYPASLVPTPRVSITVSPGNDINLNNPVTFTANASGCANMKYAWYVNGTQVPGVYSNIYTTTKMLNMDKVWCKAICDDTCPSPADTVSNTITMQVSTSISEVKTANGIKVYPNPNSGKFIVELDNIDKIETLTVTNVMGQAVHSQTTERMITEIDLQLPAGVYTLHAGNTNTKIIITR